MAGAQDLLDDHVAVGPGICGDLTHGGSQGPLHDLDAGALIATQGGGEAA